MKEVFLVKDHQFGYLTEQTPGVSYTFRHEIKEAFKFNSYPDAQKAIEEVFKTAIGHQHTSSPFLKNISVPDPSSLLIKITKLFVHVS